MLVDRIINILPLKNEFLKLLIGSILTALMLSFGMVYILKIIHFPINPSIPATFAAIGTAIYAARFRNKK